MSLLPLPTPTPASRCPFRLFRIPHARVQNIPTNARKLVIVGWDIEIETTHDVVSFQTLAERHDAREVNVVHGEIEV